MDTRQTLEAFDRFLAGKRLRLEAVVIGGAALELLQVSPWLAHQDANPDWPAHVQETLRDLGRRLGHGL
jgi:hypothetical protein